MKKRVNNDIFINWTILRNEIAEDFSDAVNVKLVARIVNSKDLDITDFSGREDNVFYIRIPAGQLNIGTYTLILTYQKPDATIVGGFASHGLDIKNAFEVVRNSEQEDDEGRDITSDAHYAVDGATFIPAITWVEGDISLSWTNNRALPNPDPVILNEGVPESVLAANSAANLANQKAGLAQEAADNANAKAGIANTSAQTANNAADLANEVATHPPVITEGTWHYWNASTNAYVDTNIAATPYENYLQNTTDDPVLTESEWSLWSKEQGDFAKEQGELAQTARGNIEGDLSLKIDKTAITNDLGDSEELVVSQKAVTDELALKASHGYASSPKTLKEVDDNLIQLAGEVNEKIYKALNVGAAGLVTIKPTTSYYTYKLNVLDNVTINIDLSKMIQQVGNARCRLIIDMPIVRTITLTKPLLWGGTEPTFAAAGQYIFEIIDVDGTGTPLIWQVASTTKVEPTGNILFVDSTGADYSVAQINGEIADRTTSSWISPFKYLQNAINAAQAGDIIFVKQGIYKPTHLRTTPTVYVDGDRLNRNATFTPKNGVDIYGGFVGTETKTWQRVMDANGYPVNKTILCGDIAGEATVDPAKTVGDTRTDASKANAAYNVVFGKAISALTYLNGVNVRYGNASEATGDQASGGGIYSAALFVGINNTSYNNTATRLGGGWVYGTNTNCTAYSNTAVAGGGWREGTNTNCTAYSNTAATSGGGWNLGTNTNCTAYSNTSAYGGGWRDGTNTNCTAYSNTGTYSGGWYGGTNTNCTAYSNTATSAGGWNTGTNTNCTGVNNKAPQAVFGSLTTDRHINCLLYNNKTTAGVTVGFDDKAATDVKIFRNNAYDVTHPTITGGTGSDINTATCIANLTAEQAKIDVPTFIGTAETPEQLAELHAYAATITTKLKPKAGSILKGAGVNNATYPNPTDYEGTERPEASTIGILEGE